MLILAPKKEERALVQDKFASCNLRLVPILIYVVKFEWRDPLRQLPRTSGESTIDTMEKGYGKDCFSIDKF